MIYVSEIPGRNLQRSDSTGQGRREDARFAHAQEGVDALAPDKVIHHVRAHVRSLIEEREESVIVTRSDGPLHFEGVSDGRRGLLGRC